MRNETAQQREFYDCCNGIELQKVQQQTVERANDA